MTLKTLFLRRGYLLPLFLSLFVDNVRGTPVRAAALLAAVAWTAFVFHGLNRRPAFPRALLIFLAWCAAGLAYSAYRAGTLAELSLLAGAVVLWAGASVLWQAHPEERPMLPRFLIALGLLKAATVLLWPSSGGRLFLDPGEAGVANNALSAMFLALALIAGGWHAEKPWRAAWGALLVLTLWICLRWNAMAALLGLAAGIPLAAAFRRKSRGFLLGAGIGSLALLGIFFSPAAPRWLQYNPGNPGRFERLTIWRDSLVYLRAHPWVGTGLGTFEQHYPQFKTFPALKTANHAHNDWLQAACETGLPGAACLAFLLVAFFRRLKTGAPAAPAAAAGLLALGLWSCVYYPFRSDPLLFTGALLLAALFSAHTVPLDRKDLAFSSVSAALLVLVALSQGAGQTAERWGASAWDRNDPAVALDRFRWAARLDPLEPRYLTHQVECLRLLNRRDEAILLLEKALALKPRDLWTRRTLAVARLHALGPDAARETYAPILALAPNVEQFRREYADLPAPKPIK